MTPKEVLIAARKLISDPKRWTKGTLARKANGDACDPNSEDAACWCAQGALFRASPDGRAGRYSLLLGRAVRQDGCQYTWSMNDRAKNAHARILAAYDRAIAECDE